MKNKIIPLAAMYLIVILLVISALTVITEDRDAPRIIFGDEEIEYVEGEVTKVLLSNVSAVDEVEGDVSYTLTVESIRVLADGKKINVIYVARDSKNNIVKDSRIIKYQALVENGMTEEITDEITEEITDEITEEITDEIDTTSEVNSETIEPDGVGISDEEGTESILNPEDQDIDQGEPTDVIEEEEAIQEETEENPLVSTGDPIIKLNTHSVTITAGDYFNIMNYIEAAVDDKDDAWRRIYINGDYSSEIPGEYSIRFSITDSDGNTSNIERLTLIVE